MLGKYLERRSRSQLKTSRMRRHTVATNCQSLHTQTAQDGCTDKTRSIRAQETAHLQHCHLTSKVCPFPPLRQPPSDPQSPAHNVSPWHVSAQRFTWEHKRCKVVLANSTVIELREIASQWRSLEHTIRFPSHRKRERARRGRTSSLIRREQSTG